MSNDAFIDVRRHETKLEKACKGQWVLGSFNEVLIIVLTKRLHYSFFGGG
jgi:hypothetical protein